MSTLSPNMSLQLPVVGQEPGPNWATELNADLTILDQHTHAPGSGVPITPDAMNMNADLTFNGFSATNLTSIQYTPVASLATLTSLYVIDKELFYNDGAGNAVQLTLNGSIVGTSGSISGLAAPASASYSANTFIFQSNVLTAANLDAASIVLRNNTASSYGLTLSPPNAMGANYALTLPSLPVSTRILSMTSTGAINAGSAGVVVTADLADGSVTAIKQAALTYQLSSSTGLFASTSPTLTQVTNATVTITTSGRPVFVGLIDAGSGGGLVSGLSVVKNSGAGLAQGIYAIFRDSTQLVATRLRTQASPNGTSIDMTIPSSALYVIDFPAAGTYTYTVQVSTTDTIQVTYSKLVAYEL